jgi:hypothetical protein
MRRQDAKSAKEDAKEGETDWADRRGDGQVLEVGQPAERGHAGVGHARAAEVE